MTDIEPAPLDVSGPRLAAYAGLAAVAAFVWAIAGPPELTWWGGIAALVVVEPAVHRTTAGRRRLAANPGAVVDHTGLSARDELVSVALITALLLASFLGLSALTGGTHGPWNAVATMFVILAAGDISRMILRRQATRTADPGAAFGR